MEEVRHAMKCIDCGRSPVEIRRENHRYVECGLESVTIVNAEVRHCPECGENEYVIPDIEGLHACIANVIASKPEQLVPKEIRFLRKYLGLSTKDFAAKIGVRPETVSRWERVEDSKPMDVPTERFLRLMVFHERPADHYPRARLEDTAVRSAAACKMRIAPGAKGWEPREARAG
jgi:putative zinc finger/helix-turn-helix YgiT family protein